MDAADLTGVNIAASAVVAPKASDKASCCVVCEKLLKSALLLPCLHLICHPCADSDKDVVCKTCDLTLAVHQRSDLCEAVFAAKLFVQSQTNEGREAACGMCQNCGPHPAVCYCPECTKWMCSTARGFHSQIAPIHTVIELDRAANGAANDEENNLNSICRRHSMKHEYFCTQCDLVICLKCKVEDHEGHETKTLDSVLGNIQDNVANKLQLLQQSLPDFDCSLTDKARCEGVEMRAQLQRKLQAEEARLTLPVRKEREKQEEHADLLLKQHKQKCEQAQQQLVQNTERVAHLKLRAQQIFAEGSKRERILLLRQLSIPLSEVNVPELSLPPVKFSYEYKKKDSTAEDTETPEREEGETEADAEAKAKFWKGARVVRNVGWKGNQEMKEFAVGTVQCITDKIKVKWDESNKIVDHIASELRLVSEMNAQEASRYFVNGSRVERGINWTWSDQDGGRGNFGTVTAVSTSWIKVCWDKTQMMNSYRNGQNGCYDLKLVDQL